MGLTPRLDAQPGLRLLSYLSLLPASAVELDDELVTSIKRFDPDTQRTLAEEKSVFVHPARQTLTDTATRKQVRETVRLLAPTPLIGSVLNRFQNQFFTDEYGYGFSYGYGGYY